MFSRDEGIYKTPQDDKEKILGAYKNLVSKINRDTKTGKLKGYNPSTMQGRMMNKNEIIYNNIISTFLNLGLFHIVMRVHYLSCLSGWKSFPM